MPPRIRLPSAQLPHTIASQYICRQCRCASVATAASSPSSPQVDQNRLAAALVSRHRPTQPPSHKPAEFRKTQLHRQYQSLLRSSPVMLIFQHNNLKSTEFMSIRRELASAMAKVDAELAKAGNNEFIGDHAKLQVVQTGIFASALKIVEFWDPNYERETAEAAVAAAKVPAASAKSLELEQAQAAQARAAHGLSREAWEAARKNRELRHGLEPLLSGPLALFVLPTVSTAHLKAALSILAPSKAFPAPKRKTNPTYYENAVQLGLQKLMLLGARIEGKAFDAEGAQWVGGINGGLGGLRAQLVAALQGFGAGLTTTLEAAGKSLYLTVEGRRTMLEEEAKPASDKQESA